MRGGHMIGVEEGLLRDLPVGRNRNRLPPVVTHQIDGENLHDRTDGGDELIERLRPLIEVDENEAGQHRPLQLMQTHVAVAELAAMELLLVQDILVTTGQIPAPAMERTND